MSTDLAQFLRSYTGEPSTRAIAGRIGMDHSTLGRQLIAGPRIETIVLVCRSYGLPFLPAFVAAGFINSDEADKIDGRVSLTRATDRELLEELLRRVDDGTDHSMLTDPIDVALEQDDVALAASEGRDIEGEQERLAEGP